MSAATLGVIANIVEYAAMKGIAYRQAEEVAKRDYWHILGEIHRGGVEC